MNFVPNFLSLLFPGFPVDRDIHRWQVLFLDQFPFFNIATALLSLSVLDLFRRLFINLTVCEWAPFLQTDNHSWSCRTSILEGATFHKMNWCKFLWGNPCMAIETFFHWCFYLWDFGSSMVFAHSACMKEFGDGFDGELFTTLIHIVAETTIVSFHTLPVGFPLPTISKNSLYTLFCPPDSWPTAFFSTFPFLLPKFLFRISCSILLFNIVFQSVGNQVLTSSDESSKSYNSNTVFNFSDSRTLNFYNPSKMSSDGILVIDN